MCVLVCICGLVQKEPHLSQQLLGSVPEMLHGIKRV